jgi:hypothetical protein
VPARTCVTLRLDTEGKCSLLVAVAVSSSALAQERIEIPLDIKVDKRAFVNTEPETKEDAKGSVVTATADAVVVPINLRPGPESLDEYIETPDSVLAANELARLGYMKTQGELHQVLIESVTMEREPRREYPLGRLCYTATDLDRLERIEFCAETFFGILEPLPGSRASLPAQPLVADTVYAVVLDGYEMIGKDSSLQLWHYFEGGAQ